MIHRVLDDWEILLSGIRDGIIPDIKHVDLFGHTCKRALVIYRTTVEFEESLV